MMKLELYQYVALCRDIPEHNLKRGDVAMLIYYVTHPSNGEDGYILEVFNVAGDSMTVFTVPISFSSSQHPVNNSGSSVLVILN